MKAARQSILEGELPALSALNSSVPASGPAPLQNLKTANALLLERLSTAFEGFSGAEVAALETLAVQCAAIGGEGVHLARALLAEHRQEAEWAYPDDCLPAAPGIGLRQPVPNGGQASAEPFLWPNPASRRALLELPSGHNWAWAAVFNAQGQELRRTALSPGQRQAELSTEGWAPGLYFLRLGPGGGGPVLKLAVTGR